MNDTAASAVLNATLATIADPVILVDRGGRLVAHNFASATLFGEPLERLAATLLATPIPDGQLEGERPLGEWVARGEAVPALAIQLPGQSGETIEATLSLAPIMVDPGQPIAACLVIRPQPVAPAGPEPGHDPLDRLFFDAMPGHSYIHRPSTHPDNGLLRFSPQLEQLLGYPPALWATDRAFRERIVHPDDRAQWRAAYQAVTPATREFRHEFRITTADGTVRWIRDQANLVTDQAGEPYWLGFLSDISDQKRAEAAAAAANADLERAHHALLALSQAKSEFVTIISHEFRTPLTSIQGFSELLISEEIAAADAQTFLQAIHENARRLARMVENILDLDHMEQGQLRITLAPVDLNDLIQQALASLQPSTSRHPLMADLAPALPAVLGDRDQLFRVVNNLVANAIKYSPAGGAITVKTAVTATSLEVSVRDHGLGIPPADRERIFERFSRIARPEQAAIGGAGLGLPITRQIVELHGGRVWVEPNTPHGCVFRVALPVAGASGSAVTAAR